MQVVIRRHYNGRDEYCGEGWWDAQYLRVAHCSAALPGETYTLLDAAITAAGPKPSMEITVLGADGAWYTAALE